MEIIEQIGSYAGLAAIVGLAVMSALYFSQARDVKRLREWAGRAPERAAQPVPPVPQRVVAQPQPKPVPSPPGAQTPAPAPAKPPEPAGVPGPAIAAAAGARPATAAAAGAPAATAERPGGPGAATPAGQTGQAPPDGQAPAPPTEDAATKIPGAQPADADETTSDTPTSVPPPPTPPAAMKPPPPVVPPPPAVPTPTGAATPAGQARPTPPTPPRFPRPIPPPRPGPQPTAIIPPGSVGRTGGLGRTRIAALAVAGVLVLGGGAAFAVSQLGGDDEPASQNAANGSADGDSDSGNGGGAKPVKPSDVTVAILNGTLVPGLAANVGDQAEQLGFDVGTIGDAEDQEQQRAESVVLFARGHRREAVLVSHRLKIPQRESIDPDTQARAGDAGVVVIAGSDKTP
jgi:LytR cell envelope-related transcriptional attenuator